MSASWLPRQVEVVVASRVRLARNLSDVPFRGVLPPGAAREFCEHVRQKLSDLPLDFFADDTSPEAALLADQLRIPAEILETGSPWMALEQATRGLLILQSDHLRLWAIRPGLDLTGALEDVAELEPDLSKLGPLAQDAEWGWRTASPEDVGTGLRASVLLFAPALWLARRLSNLSDGLEALGGRLTSPWHGEEAGPLVLVSNRRTLGTTELDLVADVANWANRIREEEERAARDLVEHWGSDLRDSVHRSEAILGAMRLISVEEVRQRAALAALGARLGWLPASRARDAIDLLMGTRVATLRARRPGEIPEAHRTLDDLRASEARSLWTRAVA